jgi:hypothetical protein
MSEFWFKSSLFKVEPGEDEETNPLRFGRQLAHWLAKSLGGAGYPETEPIAEDWGWCVMCERKPVSLWVGCGNVSTEPYSDGAGVLPEATSIVWHCFVVSEPSMLQRLFRKVNSAESVGRLSSTVGRILRAEPGIEMVPEP